MALLGPGIREKDLYPGERPVGDALIQHFNAVFGKHANIVQTVLSKQHQKVTNTRAMHFNPQIVNVRIFNGLCRQRIAHPKADFEMNWIVIAKPFRKVLHAI